MSADPAECSAWHLVTMLQPLSSRQEELTAYQHDVAGRWRQSGPDLVELSSLEDSDIAVLPFALEAVEVVPELWDRAVLLAGAARDAGRVMLVFCHGDRYIPAPADNCVMLRTSVHRSRMSPRDVPLPAWVHDPVDVVPLHPRAFRPKPSVGFVGQAYPLGMRGASRLRRAYKWLRWGVRGALTSAQLAGLLSVPPDGFARVTAVTALRRSRDVVPEIVLRDRMTRLDLGLEEDQRQHREFLRRIAGSDYGLAVSGLGNYSYRLYENLAAGRPAVVVDTDLALPGAARLPWDQVTVTVSPRDLPRLGRVVAKQHHQWGPEGYARAQQLSRTTWLTALSADGFLTDVVQAVHQLLDESPPQLTPERLAAALR